MQMTVQEYIRMAAVCADESVRITSKLHSLKNRRWQPPLDAAFAFADSKESIREGKRNKPLTAERVVDIRNSVFSNSMKSAAMIGSVAHSIGVSLTSLCDATIAGLNQLKEKAVNHSRNSVYYSLRAMCEGLAREVSAEDRFPELYQQLETRYLKARTAGSGPAGILSSTALVCGLQLRNEIMLHNRLLEHRVAAREFRIKSIQEELAMIGESDDFIEAKSALEDVRRAHKLILQGDQRLDFGGIDLPDFLESDSQHVSLQSALATIPRTTILLGLRARFEALTRQIELEQSELHDLNASLGKT